MAKKKGGGGGGANWMDTYGDMVTLLLCFFVLLYSMSTIDDAKMKAIIESFNPNAIPDQTEIETGNRPGNSADPPADELSAQSDINSMMEELMHALQNYTKQQGLESAVSVSMDGGEIFVKLSDRAMFKGDSYELLPEAEEILRGICGMLDSAKDAIEKIQVEGHTAQQYDNRVNETQGDRFLASNRATVVTVFLQDNCTIHPARLLSVGLGQWHAITNNQGEANKAPNRRVELVISARDLEQEALGNSISKFITDNTAQPSAAPAVSPNP